MREILQASKITKMDKSKQLKESKQSKGRKSSSGGKASRLLPLVRQHVLLVIRGVLTTTMKQQASPMRVLKKSRKKNNP